MQKFDTNIQYPSSLTYRGLENKFKMIFCAREIQKISTLTSSRAFQSVEKLDYETKRFWVKQKFALRNNKPDIFKDVKSDSSKNKLKTYLEDICSKPDAERLQYCEDQIKFSSKLNEDENCFFEAEKAVLKFCIAYRNPDSTFNLTEITFNEFSNSITEKERLEFKEFFTQQEQLMAEKNIPVMLEVIQSDFDQGESVRVQEESAILTVKNLRHDLINMRLSTLEESITNLNVDNNCLRKITALLVCDRVWNSLPELLSPVLKLLITVGVFVVVNNYSTSLIIGLPNLLKKIMASLVNIVKLISDKMAVIVLVAVIPALLALGLHYSDPLLIRDLKDIIIDLMEKNGIDEKVIEYFAYSAVLLITMGMGNIMCKKLANYLQSLGFTIYKDKGL